MINKDSKIYVAGHNGMVGSSCWKKLQNEGYKNLIGISSKDLDLRDQKKVFKYIENIQPDIIIDAAARVGGILANNSYPYEFLMDNLLIQNNLIRSAHILNVNNFIFLGSSCIYPKNSRQPIKEDYLLSGSLEKTNQWYAIAKISGLKLIESLRLQYNRNYVSLMPTNLYGPNDNFDLKTSHVIPALIRRFHTAKLKKSQYVNLWGTGKPMREFLHVDDLASAVIFAFQNNLDSHLYNVGCGEDLSINELAELIKKITGFSGEILWDSRKPDGTMKKLLDISKLNNLGWKSKIPLEVGLVNTYDWYLKNDKTLRNVNIK